MWKEFIAFLQTIFTLARDQQQARDEIKELRRDFTKLTIAVAHLVDKIERVKQEDSNEREKIAMQLQIELMKFEKQLPNDQSPKTSAKLKSRVTKDTTDRDNRR